MAEIWMTVDATGQVEIEVKDVADDSCHRLTADLEAALGKVASTVDKPETLQVTDRVRKVVR